MIDSTANKELTEKYMITQYPTVKFFGHQKDMPFRVDDLDEKKFFNAVQKGFLREIDLKARAAGFGTKVPELNPGKESDEDVVVLTA